VLARSRRNNGAGEARLRNKTFIGRAREIERARRSKKVTDLVHLHRGAQ
jgi:hypothetical protein